MKYISFYRNHLAFYLFLVLQFREIEGIWKAIIEQKKNEKLNDNFLSNWIAKRASQSEIMMF